MAETSTTNETWKPIVGMEGSYEVSDHGRVRSLDRTVRTKRGPRRVSGRILVPTLCRGYPRVCICSDGVNRTEYVHRLVMAAFVGPCPAGMEVCHNNGDPADSRMENLRYGSCSENRFDQQRHGTDHELNKTHCPRGHLLVQPNLVPSRLREGGRTCLACNRALAYTRKYKVRHRIRDIADSRYADIMDAAA